MSLSYSTVVCDIIIRRFLGLSKGETAPTAYELQEMVGAKDHEEFHMIIQAMNDRELDELRKKIAKWRKKKFGILEDCLEAAAS